MGEYLPTNSVCDVSAGKFAGQVSGCLRARARATERSVDGFVTLTIGPQKTT